MAAIVLAGLMGVSVYGNSSYFGAIHVQPVSWDLLLPGLLVALVCGVAGVALISRPLYASLAQLQLKRLPQAVVTLPQA